MIKAVTAYILARFFLGTLYGITIHGPMLVGRTKLLDRTLFWPRIGDSISGSQIHQGLIEITRPIRTQSRFPSWLGKSCDWSELRYRSPPSNKRARVHSIALPSTAGSGNQRQYSRNGTSSIRPNSLLV